MPEETPEYEFEKTEVPEIVRAYEAWLNRIAVTDEGLTVGHLDAMFQVIYFRLRAIYTQDQMHNRLHALMLQGEHMLSQPGFLQDEKGNPSTPILRENFPDMENPEYFKMLREDYTGLTDEDVSALLTDEEQE